MAEKRASASFFCHETHEREWRSREGIGEESSWASQLAKILGARGKRMPTPLINISLILPATQATKGTAEKMG